MLSHEYTMNLKSDNQLDNSGKMHTTHLETF